MTVKEKEEREKTVRELGIKYTTAADRQPYIFVSYKSDDWKEVMVDIINPLQKKYGLRVYYDQAFDYESNDKWIDQMKEHMESIFCRGILCFISEKYISSYATLMEVLYSRTYIVTTQHKHNPLPLIQVFLPSADTGDIHALMERVLRGEQIDMQIKTTETDAYKSFLSNISKNKDAEGPWKDCVLLLLDENANKTSLKNHRIATVFADLLDGQAIEKYGSNQDEFLAKIKGTISGLPTVDSKDNNVFDQSLIRTVSENPKEQGPVSGADQAQQTADIFQDTGISSKIPQISPQMTLKEFEKLLEDPGICMYIRRIRDNKELFSKQIFDYVMAAALRGCDQKAEPHSARWNYCRCAVAKNVDLDAESASASQFTWSSNARKAVNISGSGKLGSGSDYFQKLPENMTLAELRTCFAKETAPAFLTRDNGAADLVFQVLFGENI